MFVYRTSESYKHYLLIFQDHDGDLLPIGGFNEAFIVAMGGLVGNPARLLGVIGLRLELQLKLRRDNQPWFIGIKHFFLDSKPVDIALIPGEPVQPSPMFGEGK